jgi:hypothetical protein
VGDSGTQLIFFNGHRCISMPRSRSDAVQTIFLRDVRAWDTRPSTCNDKVAHCIKSLGVFG